VNVWLTNDTHCDWFFAVVKLPLAHATHARSVVVDGVFDT
jgi:hypothetical protein